MEIQSEIHYFKDCLNFSLVWFCVFDPFVCGNENDVENK